MKSAVTEAAPSSEVASTMLFTRYLLTELVMPVMTTPVPTPLVAVVA